MAQERPYGPPLSHQLPSTLTVGIVGFMCRTFLYAFSRTETDGLEPFLRILDQRKDASRRERGLITVSNHLSVYVETVQIS
jgi:monolysocardiolipin acyltransferase